MKHTFFYCIITAFLLGISLPQVVSAEILRNLTVGVSGEDVKELQVILNSDSRTQIASTGTGSPGQENGYFGTLTKQAVIKFQTLYAPEVLFPTGIYKSTGVVGIYTRKKINALQQTTVVSTASKSSIPSSIQSLVPSSEPLSTVTYSPDYLKAISFQNLISSKSKPLMFTISKYQAKHGDTIIITGNGFLPVDNTIHFGTQNTIDHVASSDGITLSFSIPSTIPNGSYTVWVENANGTTFKSGASKFFSITDTPKEPPKVLSVSPNSILYTKGVTVTLTGSNFDKDKNAVYSNLGSVFDIPSPDGKTLVVPIDSLSGITELLTNMSKMKGQAVPISIQIQNQYGYSSKAVTFLLQF